MCGIAGYVTFAGGSRDPQLAHAMAAALARRGPDGHGVAGCGNCWLAHARLSIIDVVNSPQPMRVPEYPITLVYNGELYNYQELREGLIAAGESFSTGGDTEVVLRMIARYGEDAFRRFNGMFGLAAWNSADRTLTLARDPIGEKPLFYTCAPDGTFVFGSEIKVMWCDRTIPRRADLASVRRALRYRAVYGEQTLYAGVRQLMPGHSAVLTQDGLRIRRYFDLAAGTDQMRDALGGMRQEELIRHGRDLFSRSVRERLIADVPVGAFLSGGLDSSMLVAEMSRAKSCAVRTYSVGFVGDVHSELSFAAEVARDLGTQHEEVVVGPEDYIQSLAVLTACRDGPMSEPADVAIACMSKCARRSVKVVLSGEGADEAFAGYPKYTMAGLPRVLHALARSIGPVNVCRAAGVAGCDTRRAAVVARAISSRGELERLSQWFSYVERESLAEWLPGIGWSDDEWRDTLAAQRESLSRVSHWSALARMQGVDFLTWLPGNLLERGDRMTMAEGLEMRPPFLSPELAMFGLALPDNLKVRHGKGKWILRQWACGAIPPSVIRRKKWGFRVPLAEWFRRELREYLHDMLLDRGGLYGSVVNPAAVRRLLEEHDTKAGDHSLALWTLLTVVIWARE